jgi:hypothetical protein
MLMNVVEEEKKREQASKVYAEYEAIVKEEGVASAPEEGEGAIANTASNSSAALQLYNQEVDKAYKEFTKSRGFKTVKSSGSSGYSSQGYQAGSKTGSTLRIGSKGIGAGQSQKRLKA